MGRALMIPGFVGENIDKVTRSKGNGKWEKLPPTVSKFGDTAEKIFVTYSTLKGRYGKKVKDIPLGSVAIYTFIDKLRTSLTQLMAGARSFRLDTLKRMDVVALTEEASKVSGISYIMDSQREAAEAVLNS